MAVALSAGMGSSLFLILQLLPVAVVGAVFVSTLRLERHTVGRREVPAREQKAPPVGAGGDRSVPPPAGPPSASDDPPPAA
jgi:hypothetical protein